MLQGDSLSPFLFVLTLDPLIKILTEMNVGHEIATGFTTDITYFVDDLRISSDKAEKIERAHQIITEYSTAVGMKINTEKCAIIRKGINIPSSMAGIPEVKIYKYLGIPINDKGVNEKEIKK